MYINLRQIILGCYYHIAKLHILKNLHIVPKWTGESLSLPRYTWECPAVAALSLRVVCPLLQIQPSGTMSPARTEQGEERELTMVGSQTPESDMGICNIDP